MDMALQLRRVGILVPMPSELRPIVKTMGLTRRGSSSNDSVYAGRVGSVDVIALHAGMGMRLAAGAANRLLDHDAVDHVLVVGIAGGVGSARVGDLVCPLVVIAGAADPHFVAVPLTAAAIGTISSSDDFVVDPGRLAALAASGVRAVDMETAAIAAVCVERGCDWSAVRVISDLAVDHPDAAVLGLAHPDGSPNMPAALRFMLTHPARIPQLVKLGRDATRAAQAAAREAHRQLDALPPV